MPQRKSHTKSRRGCLQCKQRHVKCDEGLPSCGYCIKREVVCSFTTVTRESTESATISPFPQSDSAAFPFPLSPPSRVSELRLMHHWSTKAFKPMRQHPDESYLWQIVIPELALSHGFLLDALLALSARQLSFEDSPDQALWDSAALDYENRALTAFQLVLVNIDSTNYEAIFACSILIMVFSLAQSQWQDDTRLSDAITDILELRQFLAGVGTVHQGFSDQLRLSSFGILFTPHTPVSQIQSDDTTGISLPDMCRTVDAALEHLRSIIPEDQHKDSRSDAITCLQQAMQTYCTGGLFSGIMTWPVTVGEEIVQLIEAKEPLSLAILAHYGVIIHLLRDRWWASNTGERLVRTILPILRISKPEWADLVQQSWTAVKNDPSLQTTPTAL